MYLYIKYNVRRRKYNIIKIGWYQLLIMYYGQTRYVLRNHLLGDQQQETVVTRLTYILLQLQYNI